MTCAVDLGDLESEGVVSLCPALQERGKINCHIAYNLHILPCAIFVHTIASHTVTIAVEVCLFLRDVMQYIKPWFDIIRCPITFDILSSKQKNFNHAVNLHTFKAE